MRLAPFVLALVLALAVPTVSLAQSAGDNQYVNPFGGQQGSSGSGSGSGSSQPSHAQSSQAPASSGASGASTPTPSSGSGANGTASSGTTGSSAASNGNSTPATSSASGQLARTGEPATPLLVLGSFLLLGGLGLRLASGRSRKPKQHVDLGRSS